ncbi:MAG: hypothetical protein WCY11_03660 [Novosphingobium sp.]
MEAHHDPRRIPFQVAVYRLQSRLGASPAEIALWVAGFVPGTQLVAYLAEADSAAQFNFQAELYPNDPDWLDSSAKLSACYFDEDAVASIVPSERFVEVPRALEKLKNLGRGVPDPSGFIKSLIRQDRLLCMHPVAGLPDLNDDLQFQASLLQETQLREAIADYFGEPGSSEPSAASEASTASAPRVIWRQILYANISSIDEESGGRASLRQVVKWLRANGGPRIVDDGQPDEIIWTDDYGTRHRTDKKTLSNAMSASRKRA